MNIRMEHTEGLGGAAEVWVDGALLTVCDGFSPAGERTPPGPVEGAAFRYTTDETIPWDEAVSGNPGRKVGLQPVKGWSYVGLGRVVQVMPVVIHFGLLRMQDPNWSTDESLVGRFVRVPIDRLEIVPAPEDSAP
jgi:hypothetical protein